MSHATNNLNRREVKNLHPATRRFTAAVQEIVALKGLSFGDAWAEVKRRQPKLFQEMNAGLPPIATNESSDRNVTSRAAVLEAISPVFSFTVPAKFQFDPR